MPTQTLPAPIRSRLASTRRSLHLVDVALGLARAVLGLSLALVVLFALDTTLEPPLQVVRAFALFVGMVAAAGATVFLATPLRRRLSDDDVALLVEQEFPELHGGLVSSVQLSRELEREDLYTSRALIASTIERTSQQVGSVQFGKVVRTGPLIPLWLLIAAFIVVGVGLVRHPTVEDYVDIFYKRVVLGEDLPYPKLVHLKVELAHTHQLAKGDDLTVDVSVQRRANVRVERLVIHTDYESGPAESRDLLRVGPEHFRKTYQNVTEAFSFYVESPEHEAHSARHYVQVVQRPRVEQYEFVLDYPDYINRPPEVVRQPDLQVPNGTEISYLVVSNKPVGEARLVFQREREPTRQERERGARRQLVAEAGPAPTLLPLGDAGAFAAGGTWEALGPSRTGMQLSEASHGGRALGGTFQVRGNMRFHFQLRSEEGLETGKKPVVFTVQAVRDRSPVVTIPVPGRRKQVTPQAKVPLVVDARDDYGIADVELRLTVLREGSEPTPVERIQLPGLEENQKKVRLEYVLEMADQRLQPNDRLRYQAVGYDYNIDEEKRYTESRAFEIQVVRPEDLERMLQDRVTALKERLLAGARDQGEARGASEAFVAELAPKDLLTDDDKRRLQRLDYDQRRVTNRLVEVQREIEDIRAERELNRLTEEAAMELLAELHTGVRDLAERASPLVSHKLNEARHAPGLDDRTRAELVRVPDLQQEILQAIEALAARIDKWGDFTEVIRDLDDLLRDQNRVIEGTRKAASTEHR